MEQFIWDEVEAPDSRTPAANPTPRDRTADDLEAAACEDEALAKIVVLSEEMTEQEDTWRRQLISALRDADRETELPPSLPAAPPPIPAGIPPRGPAPRGYTPSRPPRITASAPVLRGPRHRIGFSLLGVTAAAGLLSAALPRTTNTPDALANAAAPPVMLAAASRQDAPASEGGVLAPTMFNTPVLVREGLSLTPRTSAAVLPVIETVRTVPVRFDRSFPPVEASASVEPRAGQRPEPASAPEPAPTPPPLDREALAARIAAPPAPPAADVPKPPAHTEPPRAAAGAHGRTPQISSHYERTIDPSAPQNAGRQTQSKRPAQARDAHWDAPRQGLRTAPPPEPSALRKLVNWVWPSAATNARPADQAPATAARRQIRQPEPPPAATKDEPIYGWWDSNSPNP